MSDKVFPTNPPRPSAMKPLAPPPAAVKSRFPPPRRYQSPPSPRRRGCCCRCFLWTTLILFLIIILLAVACGIFYAIYLPKLPIFSLSTLRLTTFNVSSSNTLDSVTQLNFSTTNPSKRMEYVYDDFHVILSSFDTPLGDAVVSGFESGAGEKTSLGVEVFSKEKKLVGAVAENMRTKKSLPVTVDVVGKVGIRAGALKTFKMEFRVTCDKVTVWVPMVKMVATSAAAKGCKVEVKLWNWYV